MKIVIRYDNKYRVPDLTGSIYLKVVKIGEVGYYILKYSSLSTKKVRLYRILEKVSPLFYRLELLATISRIYPIISIIYLE